MPAEEQKETTLDEAIIMMANGDLDEKMDAINLDPTEWQCVAQMAILVANGHIPEKKREAVATAVINWATRTDLANRDGLQKSCALLLKKLGQKAVLQTAYNSFLEENLTPSNERVLQFFRSVAKKLEIDLEDEDEDDTKGDDEDCPDADNLV